MTGIINKVMMIESVGAIDMFDRRSEGEGLQRMLHLTGIKSVLREVETKEQFETELKIFESCDANVLHLSCHGNSDGIGFTNGEMMEWSEFYHKTKKALNGNILCLSSCGATASAKLSDLFLTGKEQPFIVIGSPDSIGWDDAFVSWGIVYKVMTESEGGGDTPRIHSKCSRALASIALSRGCDFTMTMFIGDRIPGCELKTLLLSAKESLALLCSGQLEAFELNETGADQLVPVPQEIMEMFNVSKTT